MTLPRRTSRKWFLRAVSFLSILALGAAFGGWLHDEDLHHAPVTAFLVPNREGAFLKTRWGRTVKLQRPRTLRVGEWLRVPKGMSITLVDPDTGAAREIKGPAKLSAEAKPPAEQDVLRMPYNELIKSAKANPPARTPGVPFTTPAGKTRYLNPQINWMAAPGKSYDIGVVDPADPDVPPRIAMAVRPPVALSSLETPQRRHLSRDRNYEILIKESGTDTIIGVTRMLTTADATAEAGLPESPAALFTEACSALAQPPYRTGDAWLALAQLPVDWYKTEPVIRLRLRTATALGLPWEYEQALADAEPKH